MKQNLSIQLSAEQNNRNNQIQMHYGNASVENPIVMNGIVDRILSSEQSTQTYSIICDEYGIEHSMAIVGFAPAIGSHRRYLVTGVTVLSNGIMRCNICSYVPTNLIPKYGPESQKVEYKSSAVIDSRGEHPKHDYWSSLVQNVAGMGNTEGGTVYVGVRNSGVVVGIEQDYHLLNQYRDKDNESFVYPENRDGWELYVRHMIYRSLSKGASSFVTIRFESYPEGTVAAIDVAPFVMPVWVHQDMLYVRAGNSKKQLIENDILIHLCHRYHDYVQAIMTPCSSITDSSPEDELDTEVSKLQICSSLPVVQSTRDRYINFFRNGAFSWTADRPSSDSDVIAYVKVSDKIDCRWLAFVFDNGKVQVVSETQYLDKRQDIRYQYGFNAKAGLLTVNELKPDSYVLYKLEADGQQLAYIYPLSGVSCHTSLLAQGNRILNMRGLTILGAAIIDCAQKNDLSTYCYASKYGAGKPINESDMNLINLLTSCNQLADVVA